MLQPANLLAGEPSPYLQQHARNPVHWRPWGEAALAEARALERPILLSIGYAACHWCHVMAHESFEDENVAALMNAHLINVKVDREERPDIDAIYMAALHALGEQGGWPLTMFLHPDGRPFWGGTYFPPQPRWGRPSFSQVIAAVLEAFRTQGEAIQANAGAITAAITRAAATRPGEWIGEADRRSVALGFVRVFDPVHGGFRGAPKFPNAPILRFLWQQGIRSGDEALLQAVDLQLLRMSEGGIYDHLGGGFARYSTDTEWLVPHFEKMLYDNALILELLALSHARAPNPVFQDRVAETVLWMTRDMRAGPAFAASEDADSEGEEGKFYVWTYPEIAAVLGDGAPAFAAAYDVTADGNWEGRTILRRVLPPATPDQEQRLARARATLLARRNARPRPGRDDKILADWNGLAIHAIARAACILDRADWLALAIDTLDRLLAALDDGARVLLHAWRDGKPMAQGQLDDFASVARACLTLFEATGEARRLAQAIRLAEHAIAHFADQDGSFFMTSDRARDVPILRPRAASDGPTPSGNGLFAELFGRLYHLTGDAVWRERAERLIRAFAGDRDRWGAMPSLLGAADLLENGAAAVLVGDPSTPAYAALRAAILASPDPCICVLLAGENAVSAGHPAFGKAPPAGAQAALYLCQAGKCSLPVIDPASLDHIPKPS